jgi:ectoine hydroxylase-related dioxygenase (phytanoyl-CoA dioxygenase family)
MNPIQRLDELQVASFRESGHLTLLNVFDRATIDAALDDLGAWSREVVESLPEQERRWYFERNGQCDQLRKLDNPVFHRSVFQDLARSPRLVAVVEQLIGEGVHVFFSQVFMKPPEVGGPKPVHQDNFYFGPSDLDATLTVWIALDDANPQNGCLHYGPAHQNEVLAHTAPPQEPFNLQLNDDVAGTFQMKPEPVKSGGVSLHHGNTLHQSAANTSNRPRRAAAFHYLRNDANLVDPALPYDQAVRVSIP